MKRPIPLLPLLVLVAAGCTANRTTSAVTPSSSPQATAVSQIQILSERLPSGYRVVLARMPAESGREPRIYVASYVLHGTMEDSLTGWTHLMEHIGANNRSTVAGPPRPEGATILESNALARPYYTSFVTVVPPALLPSMLHSRMARAGRAENDSAVFRNEVGRVLAELERDMTGQYPAYKSVVALARGRSPKLSDELDLIRNTKQADLAAAMAPFYRPDNAVLVIAGDIDVASTRALVHETETRLRLAELPGGPPAPARKQNLQTNKSAVVPDQNHSGHNLVGVAWLKPELGHPDQLPLLIANQLLLGRGDAVDDPVRSDASPVAVRLARSLGGSAFSDGRAGKWGAPDIVDTGPGVQAIVFNTDRALSVDQVRDSVMAALRDIHRTAMSDADIERARESLASFYERWFFEPMYRMVADHLMAYVATGRDPQQVKLIPSEIRRIKPAAVRKAFEAYLLNVQPNVVILPATPAPSSK